MVPKRGRAFLTVKALPRDEEFSDTSGEMEESVMCFLVVV